MLFIQKFCQFSYGTCTVADMILDIFAQLCESQAGIFWNEYRVIAEAFVAQRLCGYGAAHFTAEEVLLAVLYQGDGCAEACISVVLCCRRKIIFNQ